MIFHRLKSLAREPWQRTLYILFVAQLMVGVGFSSIFPFLPLYVKALGSAHGISLDLLAGLVFSGQAFTMMLTSPIWGVVADRFGRKLMVERSMFGGAAVLLLMAFARSAEDLVILRAIQGMITGTIAATNALVAANTPRKHTGYAMGMMQVGLGAGVAVGPMIGGAIADSYGYSAAFYGTAALLTIAGIIVVVWVKEPNGDQYRASWSGELRAWWAQQRRVVARPFSAGPVMTKNPPLAAHSESAPARVGMLDSWKEVFSSQGVPAAYALSFLNNLCRNMLLPIVPLFVPMLMSGADRVNTVTGVVAGIASATTTVSGGYLGRLGDRVGQRRVLIFSLLAASALFMVQSGVQTAWQLLAMQAMLGIAMGGVTPSISALLARYTRPGAEGAVYGLDNAIGSGARSLAPLIGSLVMVFWGLRSAFLVSGVLLALTAVFAIFALPVNTRASRKV
jgi:MFS transporter, DHA1 family, multidrug resistance protein